jgi:hypothetical protein
VSRLQLISEGAFRKLESDGARYSQGERLPRARYEEDGKLYHRAAQELKRDRLAGLELTRSCWQVEGLLVVHEHGESVLVSCRII